MKRLEHLWHRWRAVMLLLLGRDQAALSQFNAICRRWPDDAYALASRGHLLMQQGCVDMALQDSARLVALRPEHAGVWFNHGYMLESAKRWDEALAAFQRATELGPQLDRAWYGLGLVLIRLQRFDEAVVALQRNTELQPLSPYGWYQLARVHLDRREPEAAEKIIRHLQGFEPKVAAQLLRETGLIVSGRVG